MSIQGSLEFERRFKCRLYSPGSTRQADRFPYHLKRLPVDYLKIDGVFLQDFRRDRVNQFLVKALVEMARALRKKTVAEYVGDEETLRLVRESGVDYAQGYHIGRPADADGIWPPPKGAPRPTA